MKNGFGNTFPGAAWPFGTVQVSPDNGGQGWEYCSGYHYPDSCIAGFSHTHLSGTGVGDYCDISLMPTTKRIAEEFFSQPDSFIRNFCLVNKLPFNSFRNKDGHLAPFTGNFLLQYRSRFSHSQEKASAGYYSVRLLDDNIDVELTAGEFAGMQRYRFNRDTDLQQLILNLGFTLNDKTTGSTIRPINPTLVTGYRFSTGKANVHRVYFAMRFSKPMLYHRVYRVNASREETGAEPLAGVFSFDGKSGNTLVVTTAISSVSEEGALKNLEKSDESNRDFDSMWLNTRQKWNDELSGFRITSGDETKKAIFYTALYHCYLAPYRFSDSDGWYKNFNHKPEQATGYRQYTLLSLWDTFRALNPLLSLMQPGIEGDIIRSMLAKFQQTGELPYWEIAGNEGGSMIGYHAASLVADAMARSIGNFDRELALKALVATSSTDRKGLGYYRKYHFVPADLEKNGTVSKTLEYSYDDWCIAQVARQLGQKELYLEYMERSAWYRNLYDHGYHLFRGKNSDGTWFLPFHPRYAGYGNPHTVEGNTWQYSFFAPHDMKGLARLYGGRKGLGRMLDSLFTQTTELLGEDTEDVTGQVGQYAHGNEPSHHVAYLYNYTGHPEKCRYYVDLVAGKFYKNSPDGLCGNEDCGQMSAWYVFSSIGFYPVNPASNRYWIGRPAFDRTEISLPNGKTFTVLASGLSGNNVFVHKIRLNGRVLKRYWITWAEIQAGGTLEFVMADKQVVH